MKRSSMALLILLLLLLISFNYNIVLLSTGTPKEKICYKIISDNNIAHKCMYCGSYNITFKFNNTYVPYIYDENVFDKLNVSVEKTRIEIDTGEGLTTYNTIHILYNNQTLIYELYYDSESRILVYGIITDRTTMNEYEIILINKPLCTQSFSKSTTTSLSKTTNYTSSEKTNTSLIQGTYTNSTSVSITSSLMNTEPNALLLFLAITLILIVIFFVLIYRWK